MTSTAETLSDRVKEARAEVESKVQFQVDDLTRIANDHGMGRIGRSLNGQLQRLTAEQLEIMVSGKFSAGKSTFLNAVLASTTIAGPVGEATGVLPVDSLPCTPVLTRISYAPAPQLQAIFFDGTQQEWTFEQYSEEGRLWAESLNQTHGYNKTPEGQGILASVKRFEIGWPIELLRQGLVLFDSPGISENDLRTAITVEALNHVHAAIVMFRADTFGGQDELEFAAEVLTETGRLFPLLNVFAFAEPVDERKRAYIDDRLAQLRRSEDGAKMEEETYYVDCKQAFIGYTSKNADMIKRSGIQLLEKQLADFVLHSAYKTKVSAAIGGILAQTAVLEEELNKERITLQGNREDVLKVLEECEANIKEIQARRDNVKAIFGRTIRLAMLEAADSYRRMMRGVYEAIDGIFADRKIPSLQTKRGQITAMVTRKAAKEAGDILSGIVQERANAWSRASPDEPGLLRDLASTIEDAKRDLEEQYAGIDSKIREITLRIAELDTQGSEPPPIVTLRERMVAAGLGVVMLGPLGVIGAVGGWRAAVGATLGVLAAKAGLVMVATALGVAFSPAVLVAAFVGAILGGAALGGVFDLEARVRKNALKVYKPKIEAMIADQATISELEQRISKSLTDDADATLQALDQVVTQQEQSFIALRDLNNLSLEEKKQKLIKVNDDLALLPTIRKALHDLRQRTAAAGEHLA